MDYMNITNKYISVFDIDVTYEIILENKEDIQYSFIFDSEYNIDYIEVDGVNVFNQSNDWFINEYDKYLCSRLFSLNSDLQQEILEAYLNDVICISKEDIQNMIIDYQHKDDLEVWEEEITDLELKVVYIAVNID